MTKSLALALVLALLPSCAVDGGMGEDDGLSDGHGDTGVGDAKVSWMLEQAKLIGSLTRRQTLAEFDTQCQYNSVWYMWGPIECLGIFDTDRSCDVDLDDTGFHKFSLPDLTAYDGIHLSVQSHTPLVICATGSDYTQCGTRTTLSSDGKTTYFSNIEDVADGDRQKVREVVVASEASVIAKKAVKASDPNYVARLTVYKPKRADGTCPPATPTP